MDCDQSVISVSTERECQTLRLAGVLGVAQAAELLETARELCASGRNVVVDWSGVTQLDASIAQVLLSLRVSLNGQGRTLGCAAMPPSARNWLHTAGLPALMVEAAGVQ